jgi:hypothetical protein
MSRLYDVYFRDGSVERVEADDIVEARQEGKALSREGIMKVVFVEEIDDEDDAEEPAAAGQEPEAADDAEEEDDDEDDVA